MGRAKPLGVPMTLSILILAFSAASSLVGQQTVTHASPAKREIYVIPFSHLDLFWAGTREECLARGNRIIAPYVASRAWRSGFPQYPQFSAHPR